MRLAAEILMVLLIGLLAALALPVLAIIATCCFAINLIEGALDD